MLSIEFAVEAESPENALHIAAKLEFKSFTNRLPRPWYRLSYNSIYIALDPRLWHLEGHLGLHEFFCTGAINPEIVFQTKIEKPENALWFYIPPA